MEWDSFHLLTFALELATNLLVLAAAGLSFHVGLRLIGSEDVWLRRLRVIACVLSATVAIRTLVYAASLAGEWSVAGLSETLPAILHVQASPLALVFLGVGLILLSRFELGRWLPATGGVLICASFAFAGHASLLPDALAYSGLVAAHVGSAAFWAAAPFTLWPGEQSDPSELADRWKRFGRVALWLVPGSIVMGVIVALRLLGDGALWTSTDYGRALLVKGAASVLALGLGGLNHLHIGGLLVRGRGRSAATCTLAAEAMLFLAAAVAVTFATTMTGPSTFG